MTSHNQGHDVCSSIPTWHAATAQGSLHNSAACPSSNFSNFCDTWQAKLDAAAAAPKKYVSTGVKCTSAENISDWVWSTSNFSKRCIPEGALVGFNLPDGDKYRRRAQLLAEYYNFVMRESYVADAYGNSWQESPESSATARPVSGFGRVNETYWTVGGSRSVATGIPHTGSRAAAALLRGHKMPGLFFGNRSVRYLPAEPGRWSLEMREVVTNYKKDAFGDELLEGFASDTICADQSVGNAAYDWTPRADCYAYAARVGPADNYTAGRLTNPTEGSRTDPNTLHAAGWATSDSYWYEAPSAITNAEFKPELGGIEITVSKPMPKLDQNDAHGLAPSGVFFGKLAEGYAAHAEALNNPKSQSVKDDVRLGAQQGRPVVVSGATDPALNGMHPTRITNGSEGSAYIHRTDPDPPKNAGFGCFDPTVCDDIRARGQTGGSLNVNTGRTVGHEASYACPVMCGRGDEGEIEGSVYPGNKFLAHGLGTYVCARARVCVCACAARRGFWKS